METPSSHRVRPGSPSPLGATWDGSGTNFAIYSEVATGVELCLYDAQNRETRIPLAHRTELVWHVFVDGVGPGQVYGYRVDGPWDPRSGQRCNRNCVLLDPYAKAVRGPEDWNSGVFSYDTSHPDRDLVRSEVDARGAPLGVVIDPAFDWEGDAPPNTPLSRTLIYEAHVKGLTMRHPWIPDELRGTYAALASPQIIRYLTELGVTAVELLPIHQFVDDRFLLDKGLRNYWGYNSIGFFAPEVRYRQGRESTSEVRQVKAMVKALHAAGIEVLLDVAYTHTAEGNHLGPTFSFRGIDNATYYRLSPGDARHYFDYTGTGNTLNVRNPQVLRLIMDSLRYWIQEMHVDGFRFDLASTLARSLHDVDRLSSFFSVIHQDPIVGQAKLIAEPWDVGEGGYQVGKFPVKWAEWNGKYRDAMRAFWRGDGGRAAELAARLTGSADLYQRGGRTPSASVNLITAHDGFTLDDLVSYNHKHNEANGEENQDGITDNVSSNYGVEGPTADPEVRRVRARQVRNFLATLLVSQGTPMICGGDEIGRTQRGNNNAYCHDSALSWHDWELDEGRRALLAFTRCVIQLRKSHPLLQRARFVRNRDVRGAGIEDMVWFRHDGQPMTGEDWQNPGTASLGLFLSGAATDAVDEDGGPLVDDDLALLFNASVIDLDFRLPAFDDRARGTAWELVLDTFGDDGPVVEPSAAPQVRPAHETVHADASTSLRSRSLKVFRRRALAAGGIDAAYGAPTSTYRLQLHGDFTFESARAIVPYLDALGVGAVYTSPYLRAEAGSTHGYNVANHAELHSAIGTRDEHARWTDALRERGMRHVLDFVPNHVGIGTGENAWWVDVLENGPSSVYADYFDIDWGSSTAALADKVLLPVLGGQFGQELEAGRLSLVRERGSLFISYYERRLPASLRTYWRLLEPAKEKLDLPPHAPEAQELASIVTALRNLPPASVTVPELREERAREKEIVKRRLGALCQSSEVVAAAVDGAVAEINHDVDRLEQVLDEQNFRLSYWRVAAEEINYRRFFDVNDLAAIRMEDPRVFDATHTFVLELLAEGRVTGLRLDHTDGLYDPQAYFHALQQAAHQALARGNIDAKAPLFVVAEKILEPGEELPRSWAIAGTSGYDALAALNGIWVDGASEDALTRFYAEYTGVEDDFGEITYQAKRDILESSMTSEVRMLAHALKRIADENRRSRDFTYASLLRVLEETFAAFPVYRTYVRPDGSREANDETHILAAIRQAKRRNRRLEPSVFDFLQNLLLLENRRPEAVRFAMRFQQLTSPVMAKGREDTALYRYVRLVALNEVGCDPSRFGAPVQSLHEHNAAVLTRWPLSMSTTTTHDTKRSEDVRARLAVLSEMPDVWVAAVRELDAATRADVVDLDGEPAPSPNDVYHFYQTALGVWPFGGIEAERAPFVERIASYMRKAAREAKQRTSWLTPHEGYERALDAFARRALANETFVGTVDRLARSVASFGATNSLAQLALRLASPGVPDVYQGCESWNLSLVDPDNRRPVDYVRLKRDLDGLDERGPVDAGLARELVLHYVDGRIKTHVTRIGLRARRKDPALFLVGTYEPIAAGEHVVAFERRLGDKRLICAVPRLSRKLTGGRSAWPLGDIWATATLPRGGSFQNLFTGETVTGDELRLADVFRTFPAAWLVPVLTGGSPH